MATPDGIGLDRHRDGVARSPLVWVRRTILAAFAGVVVAALFGVFGQRPVETAASGQAATLTVSAPTRLRSNLVYQGRVTVAAHRRLEHATLVLADGWTEMTSINTIAPAAAEEESRDGKLALDYGAVPAGERLVVHLQLQVNPTNVSHRSQDVTLLDGERVVASVSRSVTVFP